MKKKNKIKTHKGAQKRFKVRGGKTKSYKTGHSHRSHILTKKKHRQKKKIKKNKSNSSFRSKKYQSNVA